MVAFGYRCFGSPDIYAHKERGPEQSINFVTSHDGFTLNDLVSYNDKHNEANGEGGRDGSDANLSWNCGVEGPTDDPEIERLRQRQVKNFLAITLLSVGTPMLLMGDEVRRTQRGNNNAYCQDNEISWFDWTLLERHRDLHRFVKTLIRQRLMLGHELGVEGVSLNELLRSADIQPHGVRLNEPDLSPESHSLAVTVRDRRRAVMLHVMFNAYWEPLVFELPSPAPGVGDRWRRWIDTYCDAPDDVCDGPLASPVEGPIYTVQARSLVVLFAWARRDARVASPCSVGRRRSIAMTRATGRACPRACRASSPHLLTGLERSRAWLARRDLAHVPPNMKPTFPGLKALLLPRRPHRARRTSRRSGRGRCSNRRKAP